MAEITEALIDELSKLTGASDADCKEALISSDGDVDRAAEILISGTVSEPTDASEAAEVAFVASEDAKLED